jgi:excisionase family DNA binding protein
MTTATARSTGYTISQAAQLLGVARRTLYYWIESGKVIPRKDLTHQRISHEQLVKLKLSQP